MADSGNDEDVAEGIGGSTEKEKSQMERCGSTFIFNSYELDADESP